MLFKNYLTTALNNILRHTLFSTINILGLAVGLAAVMLISLFVRYEMSFDTFWQKSDDIYRAQLSKQLPGMTVQKYVFTPGFLKQAMLSDFPQINHAARISFGFKTTTQYKDRSFKTITHLVDADILNIFDFTVLAGDVAEALSDPSGLILTETAVTEFFGEQVAVGEIISLDFDWFEKRDFKLAAIIKDIPDNSMLNMKAMVRFDASKLPSSFEDWRNYVSYLYFTLGESGNLSNINSQMPTFIDRHFLDPGVAADIKISDVIKIKSLNINDLHLNSEGIGEMVARGDYRAVVTFAIIATFILFIAAINFMNLSTARASVRAKEISMRKVLGAARRDLIVQFLFESVLLTFIALALAGGLVALVLPLYNDILDRQLLIDYASGDLFIIICMALSVGLIGGIYPAFILSAFRPGHILRANKSTETAGSVKLRNALVGVQFVVSISLFVATAVVYAQINHARNFDRGFLKEKLIMFYVPATGEDNRAETLASEVSRLPKIENVALYGFNVGSENLRPANYRTKEMERNQSSSLITRNIGYNFADTWGVKMLAGREYQKDRDDDNAIISKQWNSGNAGPIPTLVNEAALKHLNLGAPEQAVGKSLFQNVGEADENLQREYEIIGILPDIHVFSLKQQVQPMIYRLWPTAFNHVLAVRYNGDAKVAVADVKKQWMKLYPSMQSQFNAFHMDEMMKRHYAKEQGQVVMFGAFAGLAIFIACLGLYGLASFAAERRTKEIGIRKVLGASIFDIVKVLLWQSSKPVLVAILISAPLSYYFMTDWLNDYAYRIDSSILVGLFFVAGSTALIIAWATVAANSIRVARSKPVKALRNE